MTQDSGTNHYGAKRAAPSAAFRSAANWAISRKGLLSLSGVTAIAGNVILSCASGLALHDYWMLGGAASCFAGNATTAAVKRLEKTFGWSENKVIDIAATQFAAGGIGYMASNRINHEPAGMLVGGALTAAAAVTTLVLPERLHRRAVSGSLYLAATAFEWWAASSINNTWFNAAMTLSSISTLLYGVSAYRAPAAARPDIHATTASALSQTL